MAKKKQTKKHKFKYAAAPGAESQQPMAGEGVTAGQPSVSAAPRAVVSGGATGAKVMAVPGARDFSYVGKDLRRIAVLAVALVALELVLWFLFTHTGLGDSVYTFVKV